MRARLYNCSPSRDDIVQVLVGNNSLLVSTSSPMLSVMTTTVCVMLASACTSEVELVFMYMYDVVYM